MDFKDSPPPSKKTGCLKLFLALSLLMFAAGLWVAGVRIHLDALPAYFEREHFGPYYRLDFRSGGFLVGEFLIESGEEISIRLRGKKVRFDPGQIATIRPVLPDEIESGLYPEWIPAKRRPIVTRRYKDSGLAWLEKKSGIRFKETIESGKNISDSMQRIFKEMRQKLPLGV